MSKFKLHSLYKPEGDQPQAIAKLAQGIKKGYKYQTLLGVTGSGKTFTAAHLIESAQKPCLVIAPNKTLAAQLCNEFREFFPENAVEYFVSYYDYYQPEAYLPSTDTYIEKDTSINDEIDRLRHRATSALLSRKDVIIVASVSCIYGLGSPEEYLNKVVMLERGEKKRREEILKDLVRIHYERNDVQFSRGKFRVRGDVIEVYPAYEETSIRLDLFDDEIEKIVEVNPLTGEFLAELDKITIYPATHFVTADERFESALVAIEEELAERLAELESQGKIVEAHRLRQKTNYDLEMLREVGYCSGIENYSRHLTGRKPGEPPYTLIDYFRAPARKQGSEPKANGSYFPKDFFLVIDESHLTIPQLHGMYEGDISRKKTLVEHGFRLPSALDNRPLKFDEFVECLNQVIFVSATPGDWEIENSAQVVEQIIRPTGLVDPEIKVRATKGQIDDLIDEIKGRVENEERVLVTTLTKKMAEDLTDYLLEMGIKARYLHSEINTLERVEILRDLRTGEFDVLVGINLLREGLDLPEVTLVAILDADKEGFLRSERSLIQTIGRTARNVRGEVIMYAEEFTESMKRAITETNRRRKLQINFNRAHGIEPQTIQKKVSDIITSLKVAEGRVPYRARKVRKDFAELTYDDRIRLIQSLEEEMREAAAELQFEYAARLRDEIKELKRAIINEPAKR